MSTSDGEKCAGGGVPPKHCVMLGVPPEGEKCDGGVPAKPFQGKRVLALSTAMLMTLGAEAVCPGL